MSFLVGTGALLAAYNTATNLLGLPDKAYVPVNLTAGALLVAAARRRGYRWDTIGVARAGIGPGVRWGAAGAGVVGLGLAGALAWPPAAPFLADQRVARLSLAELAYQVGVRIPLGTVLFEEVAFRGVLLGAWARDHPASVAVAGSSVLFGVWHVGPTLVLLAENDVTLEPWGTIAAVGGGVALTTVAGAVFSVLRLRTGGILAPALVHLATNALGTLAAYWSQRV